MKPHMFYDLGVFRWKDSTKVFLFEYPWHDTKLKTLIAKYSASVSSVNGCKELFLDKESSALHFELQKSPLGDALLYGFTDVESASFMFPAACWFENIGPKDLFHKLAGNLIAKHNIFETKEYFV